MALVPLEVFKQRLVNTNSRNRSIYAAGTTKRFLFDVFGINQVSDNAANAALEKLTSYKRAGAQIALVPERTATDPVANVLSDDLRTLQRKVDEITEELGHCDLSIGWPVLTGVAPSGKLFRAPLLLFPVKLLRSKGQWVAELGERDAIDFNRSLLMALEQEFGIKLPKEVKEGLSPEDYNEGLVNFFTGIWQDMKLLGIDQFVLGNADNMEAALLQPFQKFNRETFLATYPKGQLQLLPQILLGIFPIGDERLTPDFDYLIEQGATIQQIIKKENVHAEPITEVACYYPLALDQSQEEALHQVKQGKSLVVQGPPGTGKSQFIGNLVADAMANGKRVLVVCQKKAALDVVYERLAQLKLAAPLALVHDAVQERPKLYERLKQRLEQLLAWVAPAELEHLAAELQSLSQQIEENEAWLVKIRNALHGETLAGLSLHQLYHLFPKEARALPSTHYGSFNAKTLRMAEQDLKLSWVHRQQLASVPNDVIACLCQFPEVQGWWQNLDLATVKKHLATKEAPAAWANTWQKQVATAQHWHAIKAQAWTQLPDEVVALLQQWKRSGKRPDSLTAAIQTLQSLLSAENYQVEQFFAAGSTLQAELLVNRARTWVEKEQGLVSRWLYRWFDAGYRELKAAAPALGYSLADPSQALALLERRLVWLRAKQQFEDASGLTLERDRLANLRLLTLFQEAQAHLAWLDEAFLQPSTNDAPALVKQQLATLLAESEAKRTSHEWLEAQVHPEFKAFLADYQGDRLLEILRTGQELSGDVASMVQAYQNMAAETKRLWFDALKADLSWSAAALYEALRVGWQQHWIAELERTYPEVKTVTGPALALKEGLLQEKMAEKRNLLLRYLPLHQDRLAKSKLPEPDKGGAKLKDFGYQLGKRKQVWTLRRMIDTYAEWVLALNPVWLVSPETASAIFPIEGGELFDLVVFDEASQCFSERGIPALTRGKVAVVAGDKHQMSPSDWFGGHTSNDDTDEAQLEVEDEALIGQMALEAESLLALAEGAFQQVQLRGHYRSRRPELIQFSSQAFYKGELETLPLHEAMVDPQSPFELVQVAGEWVKQLNAVESQAVVQTIKRYWTSGMSIGVIACNALQQDAIKDLLEQEGIPLATGPQQLFVKNIENVQGDERDLIIYSVGYAKEPGKEKVTQRFGALSMQGGKNRLNVAVTRSRMKMVVVTSISPADIQTENQEHGAWFLKQWLNWVFATVKAPAGQSLSLLGQGRELQGLAAAIKQGTDTEWEAHLPFADLHTGLAQQLSPLVLTDDERYARHSPRQSHGYSPMMLTARGWTLKRIWSHEWYHAPLRVRQSLA